MSTISANFLDTKLYADAQQKSSGLHRYKFDVDVLHRAWAAEGSSLDTLTSDLTSLDSDTTVAKVESRQLGVSDNDQSGAEQTSLLTDSGPAVMRPADVQAYPNYNGTAPKRVALLVFGLQRSLFLTFPSIVKRVLRPLTDVGYAPTVFVHQFDHVEGDKHSKGVEGDWWSQLKPYMHIKTSQKKFLQSHREQLNACAEHGTRWVYISKDKQDQTVDNLACQLKSIEEVSNLWEAHYVAHPDEYAAVAYMRPDVQYQSDFPVHIIPELQENEVHVPDWANHMGMNDRFAILHPKTATLWKGRLDHTLERCVKEPIHSESFVRNFASSNHLQVVKLPVDFVFFRVRADGSLPDPDYLLPGYDQAQREIAARQDSIKAGVVALPEKNANPPPYTWKQTAGSRAGLMQQQHLESLRAAGEQREKEKQEEEAPDREEDEQTPQREIHPKSTGWDNSIAVCAIMKQEKISDVREWLLYHKWLGVDRIYLRENKNTSDVSEQYLEPFKDLVDEGFLDLATWEGQSPQAQQLWYNRCAKSDLAGAQSWILFSDLDEYPVITNGGVAVEEPDLKSFMRKHRGAAGLTLQWVMFGSSGHRDRPQPGGPLDHFDKCSDLLSFEMKCFAASHHLAESPFIHPYFIHACCYRYQKGADPKDGPGIFYGNGRQKHNLRARPMMYHTEDSEDADKFGLVPTNNAPKCRTYQGHLQPKEYTDSMQRIPHGEALVLFHYMTRSFQDFRERKLSRYAGMYVDDFIERRANATVEGGVVPPDEELFDALEHDLGIDKDAAVCSSAVEAKYASKCCE